MRLERIAWSGSESPTERALAERLAADGFESFAWTDPPDADYTAHAHDHDESLWVIEGEITFGADGTELRIGRGHEDDVLVDDSRDDVHLARAQHVIDIERDGA